MHHNHFSGIIKNGCTQKAPGLKSRRFCKPFVKKF